MTVAEDRKRANWLLGHASTVMTAWEKEFVKGVLVRLRLDVPLNAKQGAKLLQIYLDHCAEQPR